MILHLKENITSEKATEIAKSTQSVFYQKDGIFILITPSSVKQVPAEIESFVQSSWAMENDIQLASRKYRNELREISIGKNKIGSNNQNTLVIAGPCSVESREQIFQAAELLKELGLTSLRAGCYKPRTSPYSFQGLGLEGLKLLAEVRDQYGFSIVTEVRDASHVNEIIEYADIVQVGAKSMYDHGILKACGKSRKPILLKRGFGTTLQEFVQAAEFILSGGNENVILCERGIRTFETKTRFTLDLCGAVYLKEHINLPVILDPSHAIGYAYGVPDLSRACLALGVEGLLIETHPNPKVAKSDASQQLDFNEFRTLFQSLQPIAKAIGRNII